jgi:hypothetical protein
MDEDDGMASAELRPQRLEQVIAQIGAVRVGQDNDAVAAQLVERVPQLIEAARHVGQRQRREVAEPARVLPRHSRTELVDLPRQRPGGGVVTEVGAWRRDRQHRRPHAPLIHQLQVLAGVPDRPWHPVWLGVTRRGRGSHIVICHEMSVHVNERRPRSRHCVPPLPSRVVVPRGPGC